MADASIRLSPRCLFINEPHAERHFTLCWETGPLKTIKNTVVSLSLALSLQNSHGSSGCLADTQMNVLHKM